MAESTIAGREVASDCRVVTIGGSAGSIDVLLEVLPDLRSPLSFALIIVLHRKNTVDSALATLLATKTNLPFQEVEDKDALVPGVIYLAPADYHLLIEQDGTFSLDDSEKVNYSRPSIDVAFESIADVYGSALAGILLSGANSDGTAGLRVIKEKGGITVVQNPKTAQAGFMPKQALLSIAVDFVLTPPELAVFINALNVS